MANEEKITALPDDTVEQVNGGAKGNVMQPLHCPTCGKTRLFIQVGNYEFQCTECKNEISARFLWLPLTQK